MIRRKGLNALAELLTRCGYRCDLCLAYRENVAKEDERQFLHDSWKIYFDLDIPVERLVCDGCLSCSAQAVLLDQSCPVRPCVIAKGLEHCGQCQDYPCDLFEERRGHTYEKAMAIAGPAFSTKTFKRCVLPYDNGTRLDELRQDAHGIERLTNPRITPTFEGMSRFVGAPATRWFDELVAFLQSQTDLKVEIRHGGKRYGWEVDVRRGSKPIISITPIRGALQILCVMGKKELEAYELHRGLFSDRAQTKIAETRPLHDGRWVYYRVDDEAGLQDAYALFALKRHGAKAQALWSTPTDQGKVL